MTPRLIGQPSSSGRNILLIAFLVISGFLLLLACIQTSNSTVPSESSLSGDIKEDEASNSLNSIVISASNKTDKKPIQPPMVELEASRAPELQTFASTRSKEVAAHFTWVNKVTATDSRGNSEMIKNAGGFQDNLDDANENDDRHGQEAGSVPNNVAGLKDISFTSNGFADKINISNQRNEFNGRHWKNEDAVPSNTSRGQESAASSSPMPQRVEQLLLLHRQKRYLLFPEGSSFQLVYDLIVPVVDYTNYAILGITCAIAWELPSKAPSEIIDNIREKLNDGTYGLSRRRIDNGTVVPLTMPGVEKTPALRNWQRPSPTKDIEFLDRKSAETWFQPSVKPFTHIESSPLPPPPPPYDMRSPTRHRTNFYSTGPTYPGADAAARPVYYGRNPAATGTPTNAYGYANADKQKFADWPHKEHNGIGVDTGDNRSNKWPPPDDDRRWPGAEALAHGSANWWERNKQRVQSNWRAKQRQWSTRHASGRQLLQKPLKHRIYPVFAGKRRRRRRTSSSSTTAPGVDGWLRELEEIHLREHLRSRQILFGKIEKLFTAHGYNGTACVLQALCETGQRHHQQHQQQRQRRHYHQEPEPQSFITELLRAIFVLPKDPPTTAMSADKLTQARNASAEEEDGGVQKTIEALPNHDRRQQQQQQRLWPRHLLEQHHHIDVRYRRAYNEPHDNCAEIYHTCGHVDKIWSDF